MNENKVIPDKGFTHGGKFHADDVFATAVLKILNSDIIIQRGFEVPEDFDGIVYDIGRGKYDHHQEDKEIRENGVPYAAFGLIWREYGALLLGEEEAAHFDEHFVQPLDESDNTGCDNLIAEVISKYNPGWDSEESGDEAFNRAVAVAIEILNNHIKYVNGLKRAESLVMEAMHNSDGRILLLPCFAPWKDKVAGSSYQFVIYPSNRGGFCVQGVPVSREDRSLVCEMPSEWWGKTKEELAGMTGIEGFTFCHATGFLASANTLEEAKQIAEIAIEKNQMKNH